MLSANCTIFTNYANCFSCLSCLQKNIVVSRCFSRFQIICFSCLSCFPQKNVVSRCFQIREPRRGDTLTIILLPPLRGSAAQGAPSTVGLRPRLYAVATTWLLRPADFVGLRIPCSPMFFADCNMLFIVVLVVFKNCLSCFSCLPQTPIQRHDFCFIALHHLAKKNRGRRGYYQSVENQRVQILGFWARQGVFFKKSVFFRLRRRSAVARTSRCQSGAPRRATRRCIPPHRGRPPRSTRRWAAACARRQSRSIPARSAVRPVGG